MLTDYAPYMHMSSLCCPQHRIHAPMVLCPLTKLPPLRRTTNEKIIFPKNPLGSIATLYNRLVRISWRSRGSVQSISAYSACACCVFPLSTHSKGYDPTFCYRTRRNSTRYMRVCIYLGDSVYLGLSIMVAHGIKRLKPQPRSP